MKFENTNVCDFSFFLGGNWFFIINRKKNFSWKNLKNSSSLLIINILRKNLTENNLKIKKKFFNWKIFEIHQFFWIFKMFQIFLKLKMVIFSIFPIFSKNNKKWTNWVIRWHHWWYLAVWVLGVWVVETVCLSHSSHLPVLEMPMGRAESGDWGLIVAIPAAIHTFFLI